VVSGVSSREVAKYAESIGVKGIGLYETAADGYFTHIDTRTSKSFWYGQSEAPRTTFGGTTTTTTAPSAQMNQVSVNLPTLEKGANNIYVEIAQIKLGIDDDGIFGNGTYNAVKQFQSKHNLPVTGKVDAATWKVLFS
jgi:peptidoglycan hydrolase-like protein with peptidoglycan-binding domain